MSEGILQRLRKSDLYRNMLLLISGNGIAQVVPLLVYPLLTRLFAPEEFGVLAFLFSVHSISLILSTARLDMAIILPKKDDDAKGLVNAGLSTALLVSILIPVAAYAGSGLIKNNPGIPDLGIWYYLLSITVFFTALALQAKGWCTRKKLFISLVFYTIVLNVLTSGLKLLFGVLGLSDGLLTAFVVAQVAATLMLLLRMRYRDHNLPQIRFFRREDFSCVTPYLNFPKFNLPHALVNTLSSQLPVLILTFYFSGFITGQFAVAYALLFKPVHVYAGSVSQVLSQKSVELIHNELPVWPVIQKYMLRTFLLAIVPALIILFFAPAIFGFVLGEEWTEAGRICRLLVPWPVAVLFGGSLSFIPNLFNQQFKSMLADIAYIVIRLAALMTGVLTNNVYLGLFLFAISAVVVIGGLLLWYRKLVIDCDKQWES